ncbi:unnamed protein product, partial [Rhizoctonia solani]
MPSRFSIRVLKRYLLGKLRIKKKPDSPIEQAVLENSTADVGEKKHHAQGKSSEGLYGLIIGINTYSSLSALKGGVSDADD